MINFEKVHPEVSDPHRAHPTDAGVDLTADCVMHGKDRYTDWETDIIQPGHERVYGTGIKVAVPEGHVWPTSTK